MTHDDPLLGCLAILCRLEHHNFSVHTAISGLPLVKDHLSPTLFVRAAERLGFTAQVIERPLEKISRLVLPAILIFNDNKACVLKAIDEDGRLELISPETGGGDTVHDLSELADEYTGFAIFVQPDYRFDERADEFSVVKKPSWFWATLWSHKHAYFQILLAALLINLFGIASPLFTMNVYDRVVPNNTIETLWVLAIGVAIIFVFDFSLRMVRGYLIDTAGKKADILLASRLFEKVMGLKLSNKPASAGAFANSIREFEVLRDVFTSGTLTLIVDLPFVFLFVWMLSIIGGPLAIVPLAAIPIVLLASILTEIPLRHSVQKSILGATQKHAVLVESINNLNTIKGLAAEGIMQKRWEKHVAVTAQSALTSRLYSSIAVNFSLFATQMTTVAIIIFGVYLIRDGELTMGGLIASSILCGRALAPLSQVANLVTKVQQSFIALKGLNRLIESPQERPADRKFIHRANLKGNLTFEQVTFRYPAQQMKALDNVSLHISAGERVGIIGKIGSGKTTFQKLCLNFYQPTSGTIKVDGIDSGQIDPADLRNQIAYVAEESKLFFGTVRENMLMGHPTADHESLIWAAKMSGIDQYLKQHPLGFDLPIGEGGEGLSNGQRQAISISRAVLRRPKILLLDEPTSAMDSSSEQYIINNFKEYAKDKTLIVITHKLSLLALVDRLIVFDGGKIVADGPKDIVLQQLTNAKKEP